jgi:homoserine dehydrogenase
VVTANKAMLAVHAPALFELAERKRRRLFFEAAVAGGVPVIQLVTQALAANKITAFAGILNGTCNFILTQMTRGGSYESALKEAQRLGFAEADPTLDVSGRDSVEKLSILASLVFGGSVAPDKILYDGITKITTDDLKSAAAVGATIKLIASARRTEHGIELWNGPTLLPVDSPLGRITGAEMGLLVKADAVSHMFIAGEGAGRFPTASAVVADILDAARLFDSRPAGRLNAWPVGAPAARIAPMMDTIDQGRSGALIRPLKL